MSIGPGLDTLRGLCRSGGLMAVLVAYTVYSALPFVWVGTMSVRTTSEISADHYAWPSTFHWQCGVVVAGKVSELRPPSRHW